MTETVEVVAARPLNLPAGRLEAGELFPATLAHAGLLADLDQLRLAEDKTGKASPLDRALAAGKAAREALDKQRAEEVKAAEDAAAKAERASAKADTAKQEG